MPWFLDTDRAELKFFVSFNSVPGGYAILSHVWDDTEQTFQDLQSLREECASTGANPRDRVCAKIREFCVRAKRHGSDWGWADTCCIDKTSSAELSEAINSMFNFYSSAKVCFVYLRDVPSGDQLCASSLFGKSRWHRRGWTLQELVAPSFLIFLSKDWEILGTKYDLADELEKITNIPSAVLRLEEKLTDISVARRMSWAARRETTRPEDMAYCLMGIFSINMPTLYGEGRLAFRRLQEEIMKKSCDTSLFAWRANSGGADLESVLRSTGFRSTHGHHKQELYLLAASPSCFTSCTNISFARLGSPTGQETRDPGDADNTATMAMKPSTSGSVGIPTFSVTSYGIRASVPVFSAFGIKVAVLFSSEFINGEAVHIGLVLTPCDDAVDPMRPLYHSGIHVPIPGESISHRTFRTASLRGDDLDNLYFCGKRFSAKWEELYIVEWLSTLEIPSPPIPINLSMKTPFRFPETSMELLFAKGFRLEAVSATKPSWDGTPPTAFTFELKSPGDSHRYSQLVTIRLGRCIQPSSQPEERLRPEPDQSRPHWANVELRLRQNYSTDSHLSSRSSESGAGPSARQEPPVALLETSPSHDCSTDHIDKWHNRTQTFYKTTRYSPLSAYEVMAVCAITISFSPCTFGSSDTLVANISELSFKFVIHHGVRPDMVHINEETAELMSDTVDSKSTIITALSKRVRGRPPKRKSPSESTSPDGAIIAPPKRKRGRPKRNWKSLLESTSPDDAVITPPRKKRGRPPGSKNAKSGRPRLPSPPVSLACPRPTPHLALPKAPAAHTLFCDNDDDDDEWDAIEAFDGQEPDAKPIDEMQSSNGWTDTVIPGFTWSESPHTTTYGLQSGRVVVCDPENADERWNELLALYNPDFWKDMMLPGFAWPDDSSQHLV